MTGTNKTHFYSRIKRSNWRSTLSGFSSNCAALVRAVSSYKDRSTFIAKISSSLIVGASLMAMSNASIASPDLGGAADVRVTQNLELSSHQVTERDKHLRYGIPYGKEKPLSGWAFSMDNDILVPSSRDQDYTYGTSLTVMGDLARHTPLSLHGPLSWLNRKLGISGNQKTPISHSFEAGLYGFTPEDTSASSPVIGDRPYASILYWSATQALATASPDTVWQSTLTLGVLGLDLVGDIQNEVHRGTGSQIANGWNHQISDGGELTGRYSVARQTLWDLGSPNVELKTSLQASVGYLTEVSWGASLRVGKIRSRWQSYNPELTSYGEISNQSVDSKSVSERYFSFGASIKVRGHNAFLQGQFRDNAVDYSRSDLNIGIAEVWAGYTHSFSNRYRLSYLLRGYSSEIKRGEGDRNVVWGGLTLSKVY